MSISPSLNPGSTTSSSSSLSPSQSSTPNHGTVISSNQALQVSDSPLPPHAHDTSGQVAQAHDPGGSSREVRRNERRNHVKNPIHQNGGKTSQPDNALSSQITHGHSTGRKSQTFNGNHLLNFHYDPIPVFRPQNRAPPPRKYQKRRAYNKDLFLQANYKFVVLDSGNYVAESMDPDKMLSWDDIIYLKYASPFPVHCPICLDDPLCPQITSCGHIFCFPCILQYFSIGEEVDLIKAECWKKCPLCTAMISSKDLYTICIEHVKQYKVGDEIEFVLLSREKGSFSSSFKHVEEEILDSFSKFTLTSDVELSVREAMSDLDSWIARANSGLVDDIEKLPYVCAAIEQLERRKKYWKEHRSFVGEKESASSYRSPVLVKNDNTDLYGKSSIGKFNDPIEDHERSSYSSIDDNKNSEAVSVDINERKYGDSYNFYQATDGQHIILHPLSMKCLLHHYGNSENLPNRITGKILQLETVTQSEAMRRRYRFLSHFSLTTTFQLCEINMRDKLPAESISPFMDEIKNREKQRNQVARKEHKEKIKAEAAESQFVPVPVPYCSYDPSPTFSADDFEALGSHADVASSSSWPPPTTGERQSFSNVARLGFAAAHDSPSLEVPTAPKIDTPSPAGWKNSGTSFANIASRTKSDVETPAKPEAGKKGKKSSRILMSTAGGRRY